MDLLQTLLVYMSLVFATSVQTAPEPSVIPETEDYAAAYVQATPDPTVAATPVPTINMTPNPAYKTLQVGDKGTKVREMQAKLQEYGYYQGEVDGAYGNQSRQAVEQFQYMHGLTVDGIAGRHTLTVLFESSEIRPPQGGAAVFPSPEAQLSVAITPTPSPESTGTPIPVLTATPVPTPTPKPLPSEEPAPVVIMEGYSVTLDGAETDMLAFRSGETIFLPVLDVLKSAGMNVISSSTLEMDEYAFASGFSLIRFTHTENQHGEPLDLQVYCNDEPQLVPNRSLYSNNDVLYMPVESIESMLDFQCEIDEENALIKLNGQKE